ncbi:hypothetical protein BpHYR1_000115, partial [Brachionus plicatilis]
MNANGHQTLLRMFPIVDEETFVEFPTYIYQRIGPVRYFRILDEKERPDTVAFVKFYADQDHVKLFDYVFNAPRFTFEGKEHKLQVRLNVDISRETIEVEYPNMLVYMRPTRSTRPKWCRLVKPREADKTEEPSEQKRTDKSRPVDAVASEEYEGIAVAAGPTGGETQISGTDSAIGQPK